MSLARKPTASDCPLNAVVPGGEGGAQRRESDRCRLTSARSNTVQVPRRLED
jgi:hypothetical protein